MQNDSKIKQLGKGTFLHEEEGDLVSSPASHRKHRSKPVDALKLFRGMPRYLLAANGA